LRGLILELGAKNKSLDVILAIKQSYEKIFNQFDFLLEE